ncbi:MAG: thioredoxin domain-containing protein [Actinomycetota bacterium]|nr:thioredoxin domain-containing protein [Actinomycetota bacterium]
MPNRLAQETSPYLLQHKDNPVDWRPWGEEALSEARDRNVPLLVSIGYSACHWCHVMERESFEDEGTAALMNARFVCVKVDREERPDVDAIYMDAVQAMTGHGGWPLNAFVTPEQVPFYAGTYFPAEPRQGMPSWRQVLDAVSDAWQERGEEIRAGSERIVPRLRGGAALEPSSQPIDAGSLEDAVAGLRESYDSAHGGFGGAPKFPPASTIELLLRRGEREMSRGTLRAMAAGGIYDQVGGGFARYAVDGTWTVPHFEKMLYDNALLARAYLHGFQVFGDEGFRRVTCETLDWTLREMRGEEGGFASALDADSEGVEGKYYVWTLAELREELGGLADAAIAYFGATEGGNFEGANVLEARGPRPDCLSDIQRILLAGRERRVRPGLDDKRLTSWNALLISALADAGAVLGRADYRDAAVACAEFVLVSLRADDGRLLRTYKDGRARLNAYLEDHAYLLEALITLYEATFEPRWFEEARSLADTMIARFADPDKGGFYSTSDDHETLVTRRKDLEDNPIPAGASSAAFGLLRLAALTGEHSYEEQAVGHLRLLHELAPRHPQAFAHLLQAVDFHTAPTREVALVGEDRAPLERVVRERFRPHLVVAAGQGDAVPLLAGRTPIEGRAAAYVCRDFVCQSPVTEPDELAALLNERPIAV